MAGPTVFSGVLCDPLIRFKYFLLIKEQQPISCLLKCRSTLENCLVKKTEKRNSEVSSWSLLCGVLLFTMQPVWAVLWQVAGTHIKKFNSCSYVILQTSLAICWVKKIDKWVHRRWCMSVDWVWGFDIKLYWINSVFWWQSEQLWCYAETLYSALLMAGPEK